MATDRTQLTERLVWRRSLSMQSEEIPCSLCGSMRREKVPRAADKMMQQAWREWIALFLSTGST